MQEAGTGVDIGSGGVIGRWVVDLVHWGALPQGLPHRSIPAQGVYLTWADPDMDQ